MKELSPNLYGVIVPIDSVKFHFSDNNHHRIYYNTGYPVGYLDYVFVVEPLIDFEILGTVSEKEITFDASNHAENMEIGHREFYLMYTNKKVTQYPYKSIMSLAKSKGIELKPNEKLLVIKKL